MPQTRALSTCCSRTRQIARTSTRSGTYRRHRRSPLLTLAATVPYDHSDPFSGLVQMYALDCVFLSADIPHLRIAVAGFAGLVIPMRWHKLLYLLPVWLLSHLYWNYLLFLAGGTLELCSPVFVAAVLCYVAACFGMWQREKLLRSRYLEQAGARSEDFELHMEQMRKLQVTASNLEAVSKTLCDCVVELGADFRVAAASRSLGEILEQRVKGKTFLDLVVPAERDGMRTLLEEAYTSSQARYTCTPITLVKAAAGETVEAFAVLFSRGRGPCTLGLRFEDVRFKVPRDCTGVLEQYSEKHTNTINSDSTDSLLHYTISTASGGASLDRTGLSLGTLSEVDAAFENPSFSGSVGGSQPAQPANTASGHTTGGGAHSIVAAMLHDDKPGGPQEPVPAIRCASAETQTARRQTADKETETDASGPLYLNADHKPPLMPEVGTSFRSTRKADHTPQQLRLAAPSAGDLIVRSNSGDSRGLDTQSSISSISSRSDSELMQTDMTGQLTAVLMVMEMCMVTQKSCCQFHASATLVTKLA
jgi:hypothetical protein